MSYLTNAQRLSLIIRTYANTKKKNEPITVSEIRNFLYDSTLRISGDVPDIHTITRTIKGTKAFRVEQKGNEKYYYLKR
jgi:hypothetical protein